MLAIAAHFGGEEGMDLLADFAASHPSERMRWSALRARAGAAPTLDERIAVFEAATRSDSLLVGEMAEREIGQGSRPAAPGSSAAAAGRRRSGRPPDLAMARQLSCVLWLRRGLDLRESAMTARKLVLLALLAGRLRPGIGQRRW